MLIATASRLGKWRYAISWDAIPPLKAAQIATKYDNIFDLCW